LTPAQLLENFAKFDRAYAVGSLSSVLAVVITALTWSQASRSRKAAEQARDRVLEMNAVHDLGVVIETLQDMRRLHRLQAWSALPDRYTFLRRDLVAIRRRTPNLSLQHLAEIQTVVQDLAITERRIEHIIQGKSAPAISSLNVSTTRQINRLVDLLVELQQKMEGSS
jgi:hypothetical protein